MKKILFTCIFLVLTIFSCIYPEVAFDASKQGLLTWFNQILPALLPFTILSGILLRSRYMENLGKNSNLASIFLTLTCGFIFGFPVGAKLSADFYSRSLLSPKQATILCITANNFSSMYVCGYVLPTLFPNSDYKLSTYLLLYLIPLIIAVVLLVCTQENSTEPTRKKTASRFQLDMQIIDAGIISGFEALIKICGYIVLFSLISRMFCQFLRTDDLLPLLLLENLEITNGISMLSAESTLLEPSKYLIAMQLLSFGGISGLAQTASILKSSGLSVMDYVKGKLALSLLTLFLTFCLNIYNG